MSWAAKIHSMGLRKKISISPENTQRKEKEMLQQDFLSYLKQQISTLYRSGLHEMDSVKNAGKSTKQTGSKKKQTTLK